MTMASILTLARNALLMVGLIGLTCACGYKTSSTSFISNGTGTTTAPTVTSISVTPFNSALPLGLTRQFSATALYSNGTEVDVSGSVTWSLSTAGAATITATGLLTAVNLGTTTVTATLGTVAGSTPLTVTAATLVSINITPASPSVAGGSHLQLLATGIYTDSSTQNLTTAVTWSSNTPLVATISNAAPTQGVATGVTAGTTTITATLGAATGSTLLTVTGASLLSITVTPANPTVVNGASLQFVATGTYTDGTTRVITDNVTWNSASPGVASISNVAGPPSTQGLATAASPGTTLITATYPGVVPITSPPQTLTVGSYAYATNTNQSNAQNPGTISEFSIALNGQLTALPAPNATVDAGYFPFSIAINPAGTYAYVGNYNKFAPFTAAKSTISQYSISQVDGTLTPIGTPVETESNPNSVTIDPDGKYLYVSDNADHNVGEFVIQADGTLANPPGVVGIGGAQFQSGVGPSSVAITPHDTFAYVANYNDGTVSQYVIGAGGALNPIPNEPAAVASRGGSSYVIVNPTGSYVYVANQGDGTISEYSIGNDGALANIGTVTVVPATTNGPSFIAIDATGSYAYVADYISGYVSLYDINKQNGTLTPVTSYFTGTNSNPYGLTIDATHKYLYVAERTDSGNIAQFAISAVDGTLMPLTPAAVAAGPAPTSIATTP